MRTLGIFAFVAVAGSIAAGAQSGGQQQTEKPKVQLKVQPGPPQPAVKTDDKDPAADAAVKPDDKGGKPADDKGAKPEPKPESLPDFRIGEKNPDPNAVAPYDKLNEYGVLPSSAFQDGGTFLPLRQRASEVFQHLRPDEQVHQGQLFGAQLAPVLLEFRF